VHNQKNVNVLRFKLVCNERAKDDEPGYLSGLKEKGIDAPQIPVLDELSAFLLRACIFLNIPRTHFYEIL
jgi:hypothetical protein